MSDCSDEQKYADLCNFHQSATVIMVTAGQRNTASLFHMSAIISSQIYAHYHCAITLTRTIFFVVVRGINQSTFLPSNIADSTFQSLHFLHHTPPRVFLLSEYAESDAGKNNPPVQTRAGVRRVRENKHQIVVLVWWDRGHTFWVRIKWLHTPALQVPRTLIWLIKHSN